MSGARDDVLAAGLTDGQRTLEIGCRSESLSSFMAARHPSSCITAVSNSRAQRRCIEQLARERGLPNLSVVSAE